MNVVVDSCCFVPRRMELPPVVDEVVLAHPLEDVRESDEERTGYGAWDGDDPFYLSGISHPIPYLSPQTLNPR